MKELKDIVRAYDRAVAEGKKAALATVVAVEGSSYRRPGARMLITEDGQLTGAISGGCLEGDALRKAQLAICQQQNKLVVYDTTGEDDHKFGVQLGCNGIVSILFEPLLGENTALPINLLRKATGARHDGLLLTAFHADNTGPHPGTYGFGNAAETLLQTGVAALKADFQNLLNVRKTTVQPVGDCILLSQFVPPPVHLVIAGAGNDTRPVAEMAALLGWEITVVDGRPAYATVQRFPHADTVLIAKAEEVLSKVPVDAQTAFVLMTHNYNYDLALLERLLPTPAFYIGILGPQKKTARLLDELADNGVAPTQEQLAKIHGPVGLDIGAEGAEEIALSILAGIKAAFSNRSGKALKFRQSPINERV